MKYRNKKVNIDGIIFDSKREGNRYRELKLLEKAGAIKDLKLQEKFLLIPSQFETIYTGEYYKVGAKKGQPKTKKVCVEKALVYIADFVYEKNGEKVVEDAKGVRTEAYITKRKLMLHEYGIKIKEV